MNNDVNTVSVHGKKKSSHGVASGAAPRQVRFMLPLFFLKVHPGRLQIPIHRRVLNASSQVHQVSSIVLLVFCFLAFSQSSSSTLALRTDAGVPQSTHPHSPLVCRCYSFAGAPLLHPESQPPCWNRRHIVRGLVGIALLGLAAFTFRFRSGRIPEVDVVTASAIGKEGQLAFAQSQLDATVIRAPVTGTILDRTAEKGELVTAQFASEAEDRPQGSVVTLADLNDVRVAVDISQSEFANIHLKQEGIVTLDAFPDPKYQGLIAEISPEASSQRGTVPIKVRILRPDSRLRPQMNATVKLLTKEIKGANSQPSGILVPAAAVREREGKRIVLVASDGRGLVQEVRLVAQRADGLLVHRLRGGENVITSRSENFSKGDTIKIRERP